MVQRNSTFCIFLYTFNSFVQCKEHNHYVVKVNISSVIADVLIQQMRILCAFQVHKLALKSNCLIFNLGLMAPYELVYNFNFYYILI